MIRNRQNGIRYNIHCDGSYDHTSNKAAGAYIILDVQTGIMHQKAKKFELKDPSAPNKIELKTALEALKELQEISKNKKIKVKLYTDCTYVVKKLNDIYTTKKVVEDVDINWSKFRLQIEHEKAHNQNLLNNICDTMAVACRKELL